MIDLIQICYRSEADHSLVSPVEVYLAQSATPALKAVLVSSTVHQGRSILSSVLAVKREQDKTYCG